MSVFRSYVGFRIPLLRFLLLCPFSVVVSVFRCYVHFRIPLLCPYFRCSESSESVFRCYVRPFPSFRFSFPLMLFRVRISVVLLFRVHPFRV